MRDKTKSPKDQLDPTNEQHSLLCNDDLFYSSLRAAAEDAEQGDPLFQKKNK
ncbi:hypothetical protein [Bacillus sp. B15-48]|uniref:hypothetical protein n=1 Tax=Bacillus sp. B15-48 TaxID=1548601 RepID=UPI00193F9994|nr:hypothetical protein [Bacillus sp. B15-48]MBM4761935.1 hypothetical protein [Bacillus sp. B15-48]